MFFKHFNVGIEFFAEGANDGLPVRSGNIAARNASDEVQDVSRFRDADCVDYNGLQTWLGFYDELSINSPDEIMLLIRLLVEHLKFVVAIYA